MGGLDPNGPTDAAELGAMGGRLLIGRGAPTDPVRGVALLKQAAGAGDPESAHLLAVLHGAGAWVPQSWDLALDHLEVAAVRGHRRARGQLLLLGGTDPFSAAVANDDPHRWREARRAADLSPWLDAPSREVLCDIPRVRASPGFAPPRAGGWVIEGVKGRMRQATMYHGSVKQEVLDPHRTCSDYEFDLLGSDLILILIRQRIAAVTGLPTAAMEPPRVFHYSLGQEIKAHYDRLNDGIGAYGQGGTYAGDRLATFLLYLNDDFDGGDLEFPLVDKRFKGRAGDAIYFAHVDAAGAPEKKSLHAGLPILRGEKYVLSQWIHDRPLTV